MLSFILLCASLAAAIDLRAQGSLTPPGTPGPTQKSLQEIWDKLGAVEAKAAALEQQNTTLQNEVATLTTSAAELQASAAQQQMFLAMVFQDQLPWRVTTVDSAGDTGDYTSLAFGPNGQPAISYYDRTSGDLRCARFNGTSWSSVTVDAAGDTGPYTSLAFNPAGQPAISYYDSTNGDLRFAWLQPPSRESPVESWNLLTVDGAAPRERDTGQFTSLAFGSDGLPAISYYDVSTDSVRFAQPAGTTWSIVTIDANGYNPSLAVGPDGQPAVADFYSDEFNFSVRFFWHSGSDANTGWTGTSFDNLGSTSSLPRMTSQPSLAFGPDRQLAIAYSYYRDSAFHVRVAWNSGSNLNTGWTNMTVDAAANTSQPSLAFGPDGEPAVAYHSAGDLRFARFNGGSWSIVTVDSAASTGFHPSLAFGPNGQPTISYYDASNGDLRFAQRYVPTP